jgi:hypothetical protein
MSSIKEIWKETPQWAKIICYVFLGILGAIAFGFVFGYGIKLLWNWLMPELFGIKEISYWQGIGIFILARLIFGSFGSNSNSSKSGNDKKKQKGCHNEDEETKEKSNSTRKYDDWWEKEGKKAFDDFVDKKYNSERSE